MNLNAGETDYLEPAIRLPDAVLDDLLATTVRTANGPRFGRRSTLAALIVALALAEEVPEPLARFHWSSSTSRIIFSRDRSVTSVTSAARVSSVCVIGTVGS